MNKPFPTIVESIDQPLIDLFNRETSIQRALREKTLACVEHHSMMSTPEQAQFLAFLIKLIGAKRAIEIGVFTGYGTLAIAQALPTDGLLVACDHDHRWPSIGKKFWEQAGIINKIDLHIAPAVETLQSLLDEGQAGQFDFIFVDADKIHYAEYGKFAYHLLREGGLLVFDNIIWVGEQRVVQREVPATRAVSLFLESITSDDRFEVTLIPIAQGMLLARKHVYNGEIGSRE